GRTSTVMPYFSIGADLAISDASFRLSACTRRYPPTASLDSAKGPSTTSCPLVPEIILPCAPSGCPVLILPCWFSPSNHAMTLSMAAWSSCCERPLSQCGPRNSSMYSPVVVSVFIFFSVCCWLSMLRRTSDCLQDNYFAFSSDCQRAKVFFSVSSQTTK